MALVSLSTVRRKKIEIVPEAVFFRIRTMLFEPGTLVCRSMKGTVSYFRRKSINVKDCVFNSQFNKITMKHNKESVDKNSEELSILSSSVYTESGVFLGIVTDFLFDTHTFMLIQLYVTERIFFWRRKETLIHRSEIIDVQISKIVVKDAVMYEGITQDALVAQVPLLIRNKSLSLDQKKETL